jgi:D-serine deaminase-like pyridoxal phosphate-dependent protein
MNNWYKINNTKNIISPSLLVYPERIKKNIKLMIEIAGGTDFIRPHIKTHKSAEIVKLQMDQGIYKFKCATIAEAELLATCKVKDILLAMQPVGNNITRFFELINQFPDSNFSTIVDNYQTVNAISQLAYAKKLKISVWMDINNGMNRTGIQPGRKAVELYKTICNDPNLIPKGLHVYDGHIRSSNLDERTKLCNKDFEKVLKLKGDVKKLGIEIETIIAGGTPTFPIHKNRKGVETSPGTTLLWDERYRQSFKDLNFLVAAVLFTRVISKPASNLTCFDLGHKSVASEMTFPRVQFLDTIDCEQISQSEEHLVVTCTNENEFKIGDAAYVVPFHICPTVAKYKEVFTVVGGQITGSWEVAARDHKIRI